jgi:xanthine dehydrogenase large subunit
VRLLEGHANVEETIYRSKAVGEPPLMLAISTFLAIRDAVGSPEPSRVFPDLAAPATPESVLRCLESMSVDATVQRSSPVIAEADA